MPSDAEMIRMMYNPNAFLFWILSRPPRQPVSIASLGELYELWLETEVRPPQRLRTVAPPDWFLRPREQIRQYCLGEGLEESSLCFWHLQDALQLYLEKATQLQAILVKTTNVETFLAYAQHHTDLIIAEYQRVGSVAILSHYLAHAGEISGITSLTLEAYYVEVTVHEHTFARIVAPALVHLLETALQQWVMNHDEGERLTYGDLFGAVVNQLGPGVPRKR